MASRMFMFILEERSTLYRSSVALVLHKNCLEGSLQSFDIKHCPIMLARAQLSDNAGSLLSQMPSHTHPRLSTAWPPRTMHHTSSGSPLSSLVEFPISACPSFSLDFRQRLTSLPLVHRIAATLSRSRLSNQSEAG
jgi:hypothetical protein